MNKSKSGAVNKAPLFCSFIFRGFRYKINIASPKL
jgi:hypothetical protein